MTTNAFLRFEPGTIGIPAAEWESFAAEHGLTRRPARPVTSDDRTTWRAGDVEAEHIPPSDDHPHGLDVSTYWCGPGTEGATRLALLAWCRWGGALQMADEMRAGIRSRLGSPAGGERAAA